MNKTLSARAARISVHDVAAPADEADKEESTAQTLKIDWGAVGQ
ncbi:MAG: hypothetical protein ACREUF_09430 [Solimonas sp.]